MKKLLRSIFVIVAILVFTSCQSANLNSYVDASYSAGQIKKVVVFPMANSRLSAGDANELCRSFSQALYKKNPSLIIMGPGEAITKINEANLAEDWATFLRNFNSSGIPDTRLLSKVGNCLGVEAIIQGSILDITQKDSDGFSYPITRVSVRYTMLGVKDGKILWELTGEGVKQPYAYAAAPIIDAAKLAHNKIISAIPF